MKTSLTLISAAFMIAGCTATEQGAAIGAVSGGVIGAAVTGDVGGAVVGAAVGGVAGALIGHASEGRNQCRYRDRYGRVYVARCPSGY